MIQVCESGPGCILWVVTWSFLIGKNLFLFPRFVGDESGISPSTMSSDPSVFSLLKFPIGILIGNLYYFLLWLFIGYLLWLFIAQPIDYLFGLPIKYPINTLYILVFPVCGKIGCSYLHCYWLNQITKYRIYLSRHWRLLQCTPRAWDIITPWDKRLCWLQFWPNSLDFLFGAYRNTRLHCIIFWVQLGHFKWYCQHAYSSLIIKFRVFDFNICPRLKYIAENFIYNILSCS